MRRTRTAGFHKLRTCPQSEALSLYCQGGTTPVRRASIAAHLSSCDFCGAEAQLLSRFPPPANALPFAALKLPGPLRRLAEDVLSEPSFNRARFAESILEIERLTLTDA
jgi:hypothetical protein